MSKLTYILFAWSLQVYNVESGIFVSLLTSPGKNVTYTQ